MAASRKALGTAVAAMGLAVASVGVAGGSASAAVSTCNPQVIDMGTLGGSNSEIDGASATGTFVGAADTADGDTRPVLWNGTSIVDLGLHHGWAAAVNGDGVVVGNTDSTPGAFAWQAGRSWSLPVPAPYTSSYVRRINSRGDASGSVTDAAGTTYPAVWERLRTLHQLGIPAGYDGAEALGVNDRGDAVGDAWNSSEDVAWEWPAGGGSYELAPIYHNGFSEANVINTRGTAGGGMDFGGQLGLWAGVWRNGGFEQLGQFDVDPNFSFAFGGDEADDYVGGGSYSLDDPYLHVFLSKPGLHQLLTMPPLSGNLHDRSLAHAVVPPHGTVTGTTVGGGSTTATGDRHATLWTCAWQQAQPAPPAEGAAPTATTAGTASTSQQAATQSRAHQLMGSPADRAAGRRLLQLSSRR